MAYQKDEHPLKTATERFSSDPQYSSFGTHSAWCNDTITGIIDEVVWEDFSNAKNVGHSCVVPKHGGISSRKYKTNCSACRREKRKFGLMYCGVIVADIDDAVWDGLRDQMCARSCHTYEEMRYAEKGRANDNKNVWKRKPSISTMKTLPLD